MTIRRLLKDNKLIRPEEIERLNRAYRDVLRSLHLVDRNDPLAEIVAKTVIEIGATGVREPSEISKIAIERLAIVTAVPERAPPLAPSPKSERDPDENLYRELSAPREPEK